MLDPSLVEPSFSRVVSFDHRVERDAAGRPVREARDLEVDGTIDEEITRTYDPAGVLRVEVRTERGPERPEDVTRTEYDGAGRVTLRSHRVGRFSEATRTEYDRAGEPVRVESLVNDALVDRTVWTRRPDGAPVSRVCSLVNGAVIEESRWTRDATGQLVSLTERDLPRGDGTFERSVVTRYDAQGRVIQRAEDHPHDGTPDAVTDTRYDAAGRKVWERVALEGATGSESSWTWDDAGRMRSEVVNDARGRTETRVAYAPDGTGIWTQRSRPCTLVRSPDHRAHVPPEERDRDANARAEPPSAHEQR